MTETATLTRRKPRIDHPTALARVVARIVERVDPVAIYLFGSRARGEGGRYSDYDLMVVVPDERDLAAAHEEAWQAARIARVGAAPVLSRRSAFAWRRHEVGTLEHEVQIDGVRLHPSDGPDLRFGGSRSGSMNVDVVGEWLRQMGSDLDAARSCNRGEFAVPTRAAFFVQQAAEKLTKAALVAHEIRPRKGHAIGEFAEQLPTGFPHRERFVELEEFSKYAWAHRYPRYPGQSEIPEPDAASVEAWIEDVEQLKADFERWLDERV